MIEIPPKKIYLDHLYYDILKQQQDFYLQFNEKDGRKTKWRKYSEVCYDYESPKNKWFLEKCNQRQILPCEVVLDLEEKKQLAPTIEKLNKFGQEYYVFSTGSRGYHIHLFFNRALKKEEKQKIIEYFGADTMKSGDKCLIALEFAPHWKSGKVKNLIKFKRFEENE